MKFWTETSRIALGIGFLAALSTPAAAQVVVASGTTDTGQKTVSGTDTITVQAGGTLAPSTNPAINWNNTSTGVVITNNGTIRSTNASGRAINASGGNNARTITLNNNAGAVIESADDAFRINVNPSGGTITVNNAGIIRTTVGGQALDFDAVETNAATIVINNLATGQLRSVGQDAIRPGMGATVNNAGVIYSDGAPNNSYDGVDWQSRVGTVNNLAGGSISGLRHGITADQGLTVNNAANATITGRNGSGVGSDGTGLVVNNGTITGSWDGVATNGDGDGVDIDLIGTVRNFGAIRGVSAAGVDSGGRTNSAQGIAMGGGLIENAAGALISGGRQGILIDDGADGGAYGATTITNAGTIEGLGGTAITLLGTFNDSITNTGTIRGTGAIAIEMGAGNDSLTLAVGSTVVGTINGGTGTDTVTLNGTGNGTFAGASNFELLNVAAGNWTLGSALNFANGTSVASGATLNGTTAMLIGAITNAGTVRVENATAATFAGSLNGTGTFQKAGVGTLALGSNGFTGVTQVLAGRLNIAGSIPTSVTVANGATLGGTGAVAAVTVQSGGTIAPGTSPGTLAIAGNFVQSTGSTYAAEIALGGTDLIAVGGTATIENGATLAITREAGTGGIGSRYTLLTAAGGITGTYSIVTQNDIDGTELRLVQSANGLAVDVARSAAGLADLAATGNQASVAAGIGSAGASNAAYAQLTLVDDADAVVAGLDLLSGEVHASVRTAMVQDTMTIQRAVASRFDSGTSARGIWGQLLAASAEESGINGGANADRETLGGVGGIDTGFGDNVRVGIAGGFTRDKVDIATRLSRAKIETIHALAYVGANVGGMNVRGGVGYTWADVRTDRTVAFPGFAAGPVASYNGNTLHGFAEVGLPLEAAGATIEPFAGIAAYRVKTDAFAEAGGAAALSSASNEETFTQSRLGVKLATPLAGALSGRATLAWQHQLDEAAPLAVLNFTGGNAFAVSGTTLSRDAAAASIGLNYVLNDGIGISLDYDGVLGGQGSQSAGRLAFSLSF